MCMRMCVCVCVYIYERESVLENDATLESGTERRNTDQTGVILTSHSLKYQSNASL